MTELNQLVYEAGKFGDSLDENRSARNALIKLALEEVPELLRDMSDPTELADILILAFDIAYIKGWDMQEAFDKKMEINWNRSWSEDPETGIFNHVLSINPEGSYMPWYCRAKKQRDTMQCDYCRKLWDVGDQNASCSYHEIGGSKPAVHLDNIEIED